MEHRWNEIDKEKPKYSEETCPSATWSTTNPKWTDPGSNPGLHGERPATNRLNHGTAKFYLYLLCLPPTINLIFVWELMSANRELLLSQYGKR
jgi:hypothetical protein